MVASRYNILPKSLQQWKKQFLENASPAFENSIPAKKYREGLKEKDEKIEDLYKALGQTTIERDNQAGKKLKSLDPEVRKNLVNSKLNKPSINRQCSLLGINMTSLYYTTKNIHIY